MTVFNLFLYVLGQIGSISFSYWKTGLIPDVHDYCFTPSQSFELQYIAFKLPNNFSKPVWYWNILHIFSPSYEFIKINHFACCLTKQNSKIYQDAVDILQCCNFPLYNMKMSQVLISMLRLRPVRGVPCWPALTTLTSPDGLWALLPSSTPA